MIDRDEAIKALTCDLDGKPEIGSVKKTVYFIREKLKALPERGDKMDIYDATEVSYKNGYQTGFEDGVKAAGAEPIPEATKPWLSDHVAFARIDGKLRAVIPLSDFPMGRRRGEND